MHTISRRYPIVHFSFQGPRFSHPHLRLYNGKHYWIVKNRALTWHQARRHCRQLWRGRGRLVNINNAAENNFIYRQFGNRRHVWLGGNDIRHEKHWVWDNGCTMRWATEISLPVHTCYTIDGMRVHRKTRAYSQKTAGHVLFIICYY